MLCDGDELVDVLRRGQGVLNVLPLAGVKDDIDAQLVPLADELGAPTPARRAAPYERSSARRSTPSTARSAPGWCRSAAGRCRSSTRRARSPSTSPAARDAVVFDVSHLGTVRVDGRRRLRPAAARR